MQCADQKRSGESQNRKLPPAADWAIARQRAWSHPEAWRERRRDVVKRAAAIAAMVERRTLDAQPVTASRTLRIQTLHRPAWQILHIRLPRKNPAAAAEGKDVATEASPGRNKEP
jgi:hypothetical protein